MMDTLFRALAAVKPTATYREGTIRYGPGNAIFESDPGILCVRGSKTTQRTLLFALFEMGYMVHTVQEAGTNTWFWHVSKIVTLLLSCRRSVSGSP